MKNTFPAALKAVLAHEGGYVNHPKDPGGATNKGVTQAVYDAFRKRSGLPVKSVRSISDYEVATIYRKQYWDAVKGDDLPAGVDYAVFDYAVNSGVSRATEALQKALGVNADGVIGQITLHAAETADRLKIINLICDGRMAFLRRLSTFKTFGKGWTSRVSGVRAKALALL